MASEYVGQEMPKAHRDRYEGQGSICRSCQTGWEDDQEEDLVRWTSHSCVENGE